MDHSPARSTRSGHAYLTETLRSLLPFLTRAGIVTSAEVDIDTLEDRLRADAVSRDAIQILPPLVGAWARNLTR